MANIYKLRVTNKVKDTIGLGFGNYAYDDVVTVNEKQLNSSLVRNALRNGYLEPMGEDSSDISSAMMDYYNGTQAFNKNHFPISTVELVQPTAAGGVINVQATDLCGCLTLGKEVSVDKILVRFSAASVTAAMPRLLAVAGDSSPVTPTILTAYDDSAGTYTAATNGSIAAAAPITWAANDMLIVGYSEKFASVVCDMTAASNQANVATPYFWDGTGWTAFTSYHDYTVETAGRTFSRASAGDKTRIVWWEKPDEWTVGGPNGSSASNDDYCVGIKFSGALTNLAGGSVYPVLDTPIADIPLGYNEWAPKAVILKLGAAYSDITNSAPATLNSFTTTDYIWLGFDKPVSGFYVNVTNTNSNAVSAVLTYWNGVTWTAAPTVTDGSINAGCTFGQDGTISMVNIPANWEKVAATNTNVTGTNTPATISTDELYWLRYTVSGAMDASVTAELTRGIPSLNYWVEYETNEQTFIDSDDQIKVIVAEPENTIGGLTVQAVIADV